MTKLEEIEKWHQIRTVDGSLHRDDDMAWLLARVKEARQNVVDGIYQDSQRWVDWFAKIEEKSE